ncbi:methyl-CpG-binding domain-containing protein 7-like isoform X2 [Salvia splendens]|uniref:methyl-CpG-binding domain-containing protein 7-like isoform X2 n=1 Tax=Salvia splendens TaxID=180675 RepID=UPI001C27967E|nr:methyl-CpG-binding domain-containing protein 7-like isoform X2 [Salvia splendens]
MERRRRSSSNSMLVPYAHRQLAVVPRGWDVVEVPRADGSRSDRYYYEPGSGRKFRSVREVDRYLNGEPNHSFRSNTRMRMLPLLHRLLRVDNEGSKNYLAVVREAPGILPDGWVVEEVPRKYMNWPDKYYYEPETGVKFRSLIAVEAHLAELDEDAPLSKTLEGIMENKPIAQAFKLENHKTYTRRKKDTTQVKSQASSFIEPPIKVTWVLASAQGDSWNPFISEALVLDAVKNQWTTRFMLFMDETCSY